MRIYHWWRLRWTQRRNTCRNQSQQQLRWLAFRRLGACNAMAEHNQMQHHSDAFAPNLQPPEVQPLPDACSEHGWKDSAVVFRHWIYRRLNAVSKTKMRFLVVGLLLTLIGLHYLNAHQPGRSFTVDWYHDRFLKDGEPFRFIAGSFHYFRAHPDSWQRKLRTMRAAGLNAVTTYVEWSLHNPKEDSYVWSGIADLERFIREAQSEDLLVILRPGPYICAERDLGGFPYWLLTKYPDITLRTSDKYYLHEVRKWYSELMPRIAPYLYGNGGPIIMVQVENEYGSYDPIDKKYGRWLRDETRKYVKHNAVLFTNDGPGLLRDGHIDGVLATLDFGSGFSKKEVKQSWQSLRKIQLGGPLVNVEYYPGWLSHWSEPMERVDTEPIIDTLTIMLDDGASVNFYMFFGGTNFGFTAGANDGGPGRYQPDLTSYDYDAPMDEAGDPTPKFHKLREVIGRYLPLPNITIPTPVPKIAYGSVFLGRSCSILSDVGRKNLATGMFTAEQPMTFEALGQNSGFVLYETFLPKLEPNQSILNAEGVRDRAYVFVDDVLQGVLSRADVIYQLPLKTNSGKRLQLLVENQGRINFGSLNDFKGLVSDVKLDNVVLSRWNMTTYPLDSYTNILLSLMVTDNCLQNEDLTILNGPTIFHGYLNIDEYLGDTYLDTSDWGKGIAFVNDHNLGRYWTAGPQMTLFVPREVLKIGENRIVLIEYESAASSYEISLVDKPNLDGI